MSILQTTELKKYYGAKPNITRALDGVTLSIEKGEFVAIVGTSGSGKSTLLNMIGGLDVPTSGKVIVDGRDLSTLKDEQLTIFRRRKIGFIFQNYNLVYSLSVLQNVLHGRLGYMGGVKGVFGRYSEEDKQEALDLLKELGLDEFSYNSQVKADKAIKDGAFKDEIVPVVIKGKKGDTVFDTDEGPRLSAPEVLAKLKPAFTKDGIVTAGNSSAINDGAAALVIMSEEKAKELGVKPLATWVAGALAGVEPESWVWAPSQQPRRSWLRPA